MTLLDEVKDELIFLNPTVYFKLNREDDYQPIKVGNKSMTVYGVGTEYLSEWALKIDNSRTINFDYNTEDNIIILYLGNDLEDYEQDDNQEYCEEIFENILIPFMRDCNNNMIFNHGDIHSTVGKNYTIYNNYNYKVIYKR